LKKIRENWVDAARGLAIYSVVLGHSIQYGTPQNYEFRANEVFQLIYGCHMPLFMILSGYLFWYSLNRYDLIHGILSKIKGIMIPCAAWGFLTWMCDVLLGGYSDISLGGYLRYTAFSNWFLWAVFYCSLYGFITKYLFRSHILGYIVLLCVNYIMPNIGNYSGTKRMLPFFIMGILLNQYNLLDKIKAIPKILLLLSLGGLYILTLRLGCIELITGTIGSALVIVGFYRLSERYHFSVLRRLGEVSISIYLSTGIVFFFWIKEYFRISDSYRYLIKATYIFLMSIVLTGLSFVLSKLLQRNSVTNKLFMGR
jgi:Fucose 4-O-acetylase and related acetyltransferases